MCVEIYTERDIAAQILRHRSFSFQEFSQRYAKTSPAEIPTLRRQDEKNRQNSIDDLSSDVLEVYEALAEDSIVRAYQVYESMLKHGIAKECARRILPMCTPTRMYMNGSVRSWLHYFNVRCDPATQLEHRRIANSIKDEFIECFPSTAAAAGYLGPL